MVSIPTTLQTPQPPLPRQQPQRRRRHRKRDSFSKLSGMILGSLVILSCCLDGVRAQKKGGTFVYVGDSGVSAQQLFLGNAGKVYIIDKTEGNPATVAGHPAWASEYDLETNQFRTMDIITNSFCAGGTVLGNGTWLNVGGNQPIIAGGGQADSLSVGEAPYYSLDGAMAVRLLDPCTDQSCNWVDDKANYMTTRRWYPTLETLEDGSAIIIGGCEWGGYVNSENQNNPTYEFFPSRGQPITLNILLNTLPVNLFPLTWLLPSGNLFIQSNYAAIVFDYKNMIEYNLDDIPDAVRVYPASAATVMYPMTPGNNWTSTMLFCGGNDLKSNQWVPNWSISQYPANKSCVSISPDVDTAWYQEDPLDTGRTMGQFINLPDGRFVLLNGARTGTAGYGTENWAIGQSYADSPLRQAWYFDPTQPAGSKWSRAGVGNFDRMYHSSATLLLDGSVFVSGSNPNADYVNATTQPTYTYLTQYQVEIFYPDYYDKTRPIATGWPSSIGYGGAYWNMSLSLTDLDNEPMNILKTKAVIIRTGFSTHAMNMGQRHVELQTSFTVNEDGSATLHVSPLPGNPAILVPGPAVAFLVVNGVPSIGQFVTIGNGKMGTQPIAASPELPPNTMPENPSWTRRAWFSQARFGGMFSRFAGM